MINKKRRKKRRVCQFCASKDARIDYKNTQRLQKYITERGKILPRRISGWIETRASGRRHTRRQSHTLRGCVD